MKEFWQESRAISRKPRDAAGVRFGLMSANIHCKFKSTGIAKFRPLFIAVKKEFNVKWLFTVIQDLVFWGQWKGDKGLNNTI